MRKLVVITLAAIFAIMLANVVVAVDNDFKTQLVKVTIPASADSANDTSFDPVDEDSTIAIISGITQHAKGWTSSSNQAPDDTSATVELVNGDTLIATRSSTIAQTDDVWVLLIEYTGAPGGDNEIIVRDRRVHDWAAGVTNENYTISGVTDINDVVVFNAGTENSNTGNSQYDRGDVRSRIDTTTLVKMKRGDGAGAIRTSHQVVEFTGSNWNIQSGTATPAQDPSGTDVTITAVSDISDAWVYFTWWTQSANLDERGHRAWLTSTSNLRIQEHASATASKSLQWYVIENEDLNVQTGAADNQFSGSTSATISGFTAVANETNSFAWVTGMTNGGGNAHPRDMWQAELSNSTHIALERGRSGQNLDYRYFVVELPTSDGDTTPEVTVDADPTSGVANLEVDFTCDVVGGNAPLDFFWTFGDGANSTDQNPTHTYTSGGNYTAECTVTDDDSDQDSDSIVIEVEADLTPTASASASPTSGIAPLEVDLMCSAIGGNLPITSYSWTLGDGTNSSVQNPTHTYSAGVYTATCTVTDVDGDEDSDDVVINVTADLTPSVTANATPTSGEEPLLVNFDATGTGGNPPLTYFWDFADGSNSSSEDPSHTYTSAGTYNATVTVTDFDGDQDSDVVVITVTEPDSQPVANATAIPTSGSAPLNVSFTGGVTGGDAPFTYLWTFDDGTNSTDQNPNHVYSSPGNYTATFKVTDFDLDMDTDTVLIVVS